MKGSKTTRLFSLLLLLLYSLGLFLLLRGLEGKTFTFPEMNGWKLEGKPQVFSPQTLYEYINGAADLYLDYEFQDLNVAEYKGENKAGMTVEVYRHKDPNQAFGIYVRSGCPTPNYMDLGAQGYHEPNVMNFLCGRTM